MTDKDPELSPSESFEDFAEKFYREFGYLPLGKSDPLRPGVERVLDDLGRLYGRYLEATRPNLAPIKKLVGEFREGGVSKDLSERAAIYSIATRQDCADLLESAISEIEGGE